MSDFDQMILLEIALPLLIFVSPIVFPRLINILKKRHPQRNIQAGQHDQPSDESSSKIQKYKIFAYIIWFLIVFSLARTYKWDSDIFGIHSDSAKEQIQSNPKDTIALTESELTFPIIEDTIEPTENVPTQPGLTGNQYLGNPIVGAGRTHSVALANKGVQAVSDNESNQIDVGSWNHLIALAGGDRHTVGLKEDGTVIAVGHNEFKQCNVSGWSDVVAIAAGDYHTVALRNNGALLATGRDTYGQCRVDKLADFTQDRKITAIAAGYEHTVALCEDGTVAAIGENIYGQCNVSAWTDIVVIAAGTYHTVGLRADGTVVAAGKKNEGQCDVSDWHDIVNLCAGDYHTVGVRSDGSVVAVGRNSAGQCNLNAWCDIVAVVAGRDHTVGIRSDGTAVAEGREAEMQCDVAGWSNVGNAR